MKQEKERQMTTPEEIKLFLTMNEITLFSALAYTILPNFYEEDCIDVDMDENYIYAKGELPVMLVAHLDIFPDTPEDQNVFYDQAKKTFWCPTGLGADDRAGVYAIFQILRKGYRPHILFTTGEEMGGIGAKAVAKAMKAPNINFVIELDRRGANDAVFYQDSNVEFQDYITSFGFQTEYGTFSDISFFCPVWGISGVNLSIGYYNEHTSCEYFKVREMEATVRKVIKILDNIPDKVFKYTEGFRALGKLYSSADEYYEDMFAQTSGKVIGPACLSCFDITSGADLKYVQGAGGYCPDCAEKYTYICEGCGKRFDKRYNKFTSGFETQDLCNECGSEAMEQIAIQGE